MEVDLADFSGGLNLRDSPEALAENETPDALNKTLTTRGAAELRAGCLLDGPLPVGTVLSIYYSAALDKWFAQVGSTLYIRASNGTWGTGHQALTNSNPVAFVDFVGNVVFTQLSGRVWTTNGTTSTERSSAVAGNAIAVFKDRVWVAAVTTIWFCARGDAATWVVSDFVKVREKDDEWLMALAGSGNGLLAFKRRSHYRITDAATGAYQTVDWSNGCLNAKSLATLDGIVYAWGEDGLYACDGVSPGVNVGGNIDPAFTSLILDYGVQAGVIDDRVFFTWRTASSAFVYELRPRDRLSADVLPTSAWIMRHQFASGEQVLAFTQKGHSLYGAMSNGQLYEMFAGTPGADNGVNFSAYHKTRVLNLRKLHRLQRARLYGKAAAAGTNVKSWKVYPDWGTAASLTFDVTAGFETSDNSEVVDLQALGHAEAFQFEFAVAGGTGAAQLERLLLDFTPLRR